MKTNNEAFLKRKIDKLTVAITICCIGMIFMLVAMLSMINACMTLCDTTNQLIATIESMITSDNNNVDIDTNVRTGDVIKPVIASDGSISYGHNISMLLPMEDVTQPEINLYDITRKSNLTAEQLDEIIIARLEYIGYPNAKFRGIGKDGFEPCKADVDQLPQHAHRCQRYHGTV